MYCMRTKNNTRVDLGEVGIIHFHSRVEAVKTRKITLSYIYRISARDFHPDSKADLAKLSRSSSLPASSSCEYLLQKTFTTCC